MTSVGRELSPKRNLNADLSSNKDRSQLQDELKSKTISTRLAPLNRSISARFNKLYRGPPTPPPEIQFDRERSFILDCKAVSNISIDYSPANPKLGSVIPPYNSQLDSHVQNYFQFFGVPRTLEKSGQVYQNCLVIILCYVHFVQLAAHESIAGRVHDRFFTSGHGYRYLSLRNKFGSGKQTNE